MEIKYCLSKQEIKDLYYKILMSSKKHKRSIRILFYCAFFIATIISIIINRSLLSWGVSGIIVMIIIFILFIKIGLPLFTKYILYNALNLKNNKYLFKPTKIIFNCNLEYIFGDKLLTLPLDSIKYIYFLQNYIIIMIKKKREIVIPLSSVSNKNDLDSLISYFIANKIIIKKRFNESFFSLIWKNYY